jgi:CBS domain-containing protein
MLECAAIMRPIQTALYLTDPLEVAMEFMLENHMGLVPVVDADGAFAGLLAGDRLMHLLLPKHLTMVRGLDRMGYLRESREELRERLEQIAQLPLSKVIDDQVVTVYPDSPLSEAHQILAGKQFVVPVVDRRNRKLLGAISFFTILSALKAEDE